MSGVSFLDTNILLYAYDPSNPAKRKTAQALLRSAVGGDAAISTQVLAEFTSALLHKIKPAARPEQIRTALDALRPIRMLVTDAALVRRAIDAHAEYGVHFYDGMIIAAAEKAACGRILSEDLNSGQRYFGITVLNPFILESRRHS